MMSEAKPPLRSAFQGISTSLEACKIFVYSCFLCQFFDQINIHFFSLLKVAIQDLISSQILSLVRDRPLNLKVMLKAYAFVRKSKFYYLFIVKRRKKNSENTLLFAQEKIFNQNVIFFEFSCQGMSTQKFKILFLGGNHNLAPFQLNGRYRNICTKSLNSKTYKRIWE